MKSKYAIVLVGYSRLESFQRLCDSIKRVDCLDDQVDLVISLDHYEDNSLVEYANNFMWERGKKKIITHKNRLGLRRHILSCGKLLDDYEAIAVLEDDIYVSSQMYSYMKQAVEIYQNNMEIAGISLYSYGRNEFNNLGFKADYSQYDTFFIQLAQSWGQIWMKKQWKAYYDWYEKNCNSDIIQEVNIPPNVKGWGEQSWLKFHIAYCVLENKYFVYPYQSLTTCFSEAGVHTKFGDITQQVSLYEGENKKYKFASLLDKDSVIYDSFYERVGLEQRIQGIKQGERICVNLYGDKYNFSGYQYLLTTIQYNNKKSIKHYGLIMKPWEANIYMEIPGNDIFLYDISKNHNKMNVINENERRMKLLEYFSSPKMASDLKMLKMYFRKLWRKYFKQGKCLGRK